MISKLGLGASFRGLVVGVFEESVDLSGDVPFEAASGFAGGFSLADAFGDVCLGFGIVSGTDDDDGVERSVELAVTASV